MPVPALREVRIRRLLSLRELAKRAEVAQRTIVEAEAGRQVPQLRTMRKLAEALGVDPMEVDEFRAAVESALADTGKKSPPRVT
jgi:DNA-binding XRE family transcriptional regulator